MASSNVESIYFIPQVKFHVISHHKLRSSCSSSSISPLHYLNLEQLTKALTSLYNLYEANRSSKPIHEKEAEFRSFYVLLHLDSNGQPVVGSAADIFSLFLLEWPSGDLNLWNIVIFLINRGSRFLSGFVTCLLLSSSQKKCGLLARPYGNKQIFKYSIFLRLSNYSKLRCYSFLSHIQW